MVPRSHPDIGLAIVVYFIGMAPHPGIDTDHIREKARKALLDLLEGVCKAQQQTRKALADAKHSRFVERRTW